MEALNPKHRLKISIKDLDSQAELNTFLDSFGDNLESDLIRVTKDLVNYFTGRKDMGTEKDTETIEKAEDQKQDLTHHKTEETDVLVKAENPADDFMKQNDLDKSTHGKVQ